MAKAVAYLAREVPRWSRENKCFSCHNNGDGARALLAAHASGLLKDRGALDDTLAFLQAPRHWDANGPDGPFKDTKLARIQFAAALTAAQRAKLVVDRGELAQAATLVAKLQAADGSWEVETSGQPGSPATYGRALASYVALDTLRAAGNADSRAAERKTRQWFLTFEPKGPLEAAASLLTLADSTDNSVPQLRQRALDLIRQGESSAGGWGPFINSPPEPFDTAVVLLALAAQPERKPLEPWIARGRKYLLGLQQADGGWPATTRPAGADSYAQHISTTAWALLALMATR